MEIAVGGQSMSFDKRTLQSSFAAQEWEQGLE